MLRISVIKRVMRMREALAKGITSRTSGVRAAVVVDPREDLRFQGAARVLRAPPVLYHGAPRTGTNNATGEGNTHGRSSGDPRAPPPKLPLSPERWQDLTMRRDQERHMPNGNTKASDRIKLSAGQVMTLGEALDAGLLYLYAVDNHPYKNKKYVARENETDNYWVIGQKLYESRGGESSPRASRPKAQFHRTYGVCDFCREDLQDPRRRDKTIAAFIRYDRPQHICGGCGDIPGDTVTVDLDTKEIVTSSFGVGLEPNPVSQLEWIKGPGVDRDGHSLAWWKNKAAKWSRSEYDRPKVFIRVITWDRAGQRDEARCGEFAPDNLKGAKEFSKEAVESGGSSQIYGRVEIPYQSGVTFDIGEWKNNASNGWYVWSVNGESFVPVSRNGPFENPDDAVALAKRVARGGQTYDAVITFGSDPEASDFEIWKSFKAWSGEVHYTTDLPKVGGRLREYR